MANSGWAEPLIASPTTISNKAFLAKVSVYKKVTSFHVPGMRCKVGGLKLHSFKVRKSRESLMFFSCGHLGLDEVIL